MIRCLIIEDEPQSAERLSLLLKQNHSHELALLEWIANPQKAIEYLNHVSPDLIFLDVELGEMSAFDLLAQLSKIDFKIIFTTAHEAYALQAIKHSAMDYLLKPIDADDLAQAVIKVTDQKKSLDLERLMDYLQPAQNFKKIAIPMQFGTEYVAHQDIIRCQADVNYTHLFIKEGRKLTVSKTLKEFERLLSGHGFFRIHNSHLVNLQEVKFYHRGKGGYVILKDGTEVEVASRRKEELLRELGKI
ncbi:LytR/AlgR family response regulator transcription factor [Algoriphagus vanfongensis]|uniref:LytR/AlgR family response regulator transcription factor n=1 Tax=Algoriphagus vanfongensis TaxID=426371 RepID=UPI0004252935|nr:LytTR family DNA-binding domain-containing protein [Algoriphagus vanfongensis]